MGFALLEKEKKKKEEGRGKDADMGVKWRRLFIIGLLQKGGGKIEVSCFLSPWGGEAVTQVPTIHCREKKEKKSEVRPRNGEGGKEGEGAKAACASWQGKEEIDKLSTYFLWERT